MTIVLQEIVTNGGGNMEEFLEEENHSGVEVKVWCGCGGICPRSMA